MIEPLEPRLLLSWTVMAYLAGDNNLESALLDDLNEMEQVGSTSQVRIVVQADRIAGYDTSNGDWTDTRRGLITQDSNTAIVSSTLTSIGEVNMGSATALSSFIQWAAAAYPADNYMLVVWDHGGGAGGIAWDDTSNDHLTVAELGLALATGGVHFNVLALDACLMGMLEVAYEMRGSADYLVAAEAVVPWDGLPYDTILADLTATPAQSGAALASGIVTRYGQLYTGADTFSAVNLANVSALAASLNTFAGTVVAQDADWPVIAAARSAAAYFTDSNFRDLGTFISGVAANATNAAIQAAAAAVQTVYATTIVANYSGPGAGATGLSIYLPTQGSPIDAMYTASNFDLLADTQWDTFLAAFVASSGGPGADTNGKISLATAVGALPATISGNIGLDGANAIGGKDVDFYSIAVTAGQRIGFDIDALETGTSSLDAVLRLFDSNGVQLTTNDDGYDPDTNVGGPDPYIDYTFSKNETVYIAVSGFSNVHYNPNVTGSGIAGSTGAYTLLVRTIGAGQNDSNGTIPTATRLGGSPVSISGSIGDEAIGNRDVDFYAFRAESSQVLTLSVNNGGSGLDAYLKLFNGAGVVLAENDNASGVNPSITWDFTVLGGGTYYVAVSGAGNTSYNPFALGAAGVGSTGAYTLTITGPSVQLDYNGSIALATVVGALPVALNAAIGDEPIGALDVDFYEIMVGAGYRVGFDIDAVEYGLSLDAILRLFDAAGNQLASNDTGIDPDSSQVSLDPYIDYVFTTTGKYYIAVSGAPNTGFLPFADASGTPAATQGQYTLRIRRLYTTSDVNGTIATADSIGALPTLVTGSIGDEPAGGLDVDMYSFTVLTGQTVTFNINATVNGSSLDSYLRLFTAAGTQLASADGGTDPVYGYSIYDAYLTYSFTTAGTYYIGVSAWWNTSYNPNIALSGSTAPSYYLGDYQLIITTPIPGFSVEFVGPDAYGYVATPIPHFWENLGTPGDGSHLGLAPATSNSSVDDQAFYLSSAALTGWMFPFYGRTWSDIYVSTNGLLTFGSWSTMFSSSDLTAHPSQAAIAPFFDDLVVAGSNVGGTSFSGILWEVRGPANDQRLIIQWNDVRFLGFSGTIMSFQAILYERDGSIVFNYANMSYPSWGTVGIKDTSVGGNARHLLVSGGYYDYVYRPAYVGSHQSIRIFIGSPEIEVLGNGINIKKGDKTPAATDGRDFGTLPAYSGATVQRTFTVRNTGYRNLTLGAITLPAGFTLVEGLSGTLAPGATDTFTIRMTAATPGNFAGQVKFSTNDGDENPFYFRISGKVLGQTVASPAAVQGMPGYGLAIPVTYNVTDGDKTLNGFGLRIHYDSSKLSWDGVTAMLGAPVVAVGTPQNDTGNYDLDPITDKFVTVVWDDITGNWPNVTLPAALFTANFTMAAGMSLGTTTNVKFSSSASWLSQGYGFGSNATAVTAANLSVFSINDVTVTELNAGGKGSAVFTVTRSVVTNTTATVKYVTSAGTAGSPADYTAVSGTLTFKPGQTTATIVVPVLGDNLNEADETFAVTLSSPVNAVIQKSTGVGTITDNDPLPALAVNDVSVVEGNAGTATLLFAVSLSAVSGRTVTVNYATADATAAAGSDYVAAAGTLTFNPGEKTKTVAVTVNGDTAVEPNETLHLVLSDPVNATIAKATGVGTILNDDGQLAIDDVVVVEGNLKQKAKVYAVFTVSLAQPSARTVTVRYATGGGTAVAPADYTAQTGILTFTPGQTAKTVSVLIAPDNLSEADETFTVTLSSPVNATILDGTGVATITDNDPLPALVVNDVSKLEGNAGSHTVAFTVGLPAGSGQTVTVDYATADGTARAGSDYAAATGSLTFAPGEKIKTVLVTIHGDMAVENNETFHLLLSNPVNAVVGDGIGVGTILTEPAETPPRMTVNDAGVVEGHAGTAAITFTISLSSAINETITVHYATADVTATAGDDYVALPDTELTFNPGEKTKTVAVTVNGDGTAEAHETFHLLLSGGSDNVNIFDGVGVGTILNDDYSLSINDVTVTELNLGKTGSAIFTVTLSMARTVPVTVHYQTVPGTASSPADFTARNGTLTFAAGTTVKTIIVPVIGDNLNEPNETFAVTLDTPVNAYILDGSGLGTINDNDPTPALSINDVSLAEGHAGMTNATFTVTLSAASGRTVTVDYATADGTATTADSDYVAAAATLTFDPGQTSKQVNVTINGDANVEPDETFTVALSNASNATLAKAVGTGTIRTDDWSLAINDVTLTEGNSGTQNMIFTVTLSSASTLTITVNYATANGTATAGSDYTAKTGLLTFTPGLITRTLSVPIIGDTAVEPDEWFNVTLSNPLPSANVVLAKAVGVGTINNNDA